jgi:hypothetical protein
MLHDAVGKFERGLNIALDVECSMDVSLVHARLGSGKKHFAQGAGPVQDDGGRIFKRPIVWPMAAVPKAEIDVFQRASAEKLL